jgi:hypothetical protein
MIKKVINLSLVCVCNANERKVRLQRTYIFPFRISFTA